MINPLPTPDFIDPLGILESVCTEYISTPKYDEICAIKEKILKNSEPYKIWLSSQFLTFNKLADLSLPDGKTVETKNITKFCTDINSYMKRESYFQSCANLISIFIPTSSKASQLMCTSVCFSIQKLIIKKKKELLTTSSIEERHVPTEQYEGGKGCVRYIGGYCICKLRSNYMKKIQNSLFDPKKESKLEEYRRKSDLMLQLVVSASVIVDTSQFSETLNETARRQNVREGLTNISDKAYLFFDKLNHAIRELETFQNLYEYGTNAIEFIKSKILENFSLLQDWMILFKIDDSEDEDNLIVITGFITEIYTDVLLKFIRVSASYFRKDYLLFIKREKGKAHRKKIMEKSERKTLVKLPIKEIVADKSEGRKVSHLKLQAGIIDNRQYFNDSKYVKKDLQKLCEAYAIIVSKNATKSQLNEALINVISQCHSMPTPDVFF